MKRFGSAGVPSGPARSCCCKRDGAGLAESQEYFGSESTEDASGLDFPSYGAEAAKLLVERKVALLGVDTASIDYGRSKLHGAPHLGRGQRRRAGKPDEPRSTAGIRLTRRAADEHPRRFRSPGA